MRRNDTELDEFKPLMKTYLLLLIQRHVVYKLTYFMIKVRLIERLVCERADTKGRDQSGEM